MFKKLLLGLLLLVITPFTMQAEWVSVNNNNSKKAQPGVTIVSSNSSSTVLKVDISGFDIKDFITDQKTYQSIDLLSEIFTNTVGAPELPYISKVLAIPDQSSVSVEVLETGAVHTYENIQIRPARESWVEGSPETPYLENTDLYKSAALYPAKYAVVESPSVFRDFRIARVCVYPIQYNASTNELRVTSSITIRVNYGKGEVVNPKLTTRKGIAPSFGALYRSFIFNYQDVLDLYYGGKEEGQELMLCIMPDEFTESFQEYADWKRQSGTNIHVTKFSDINANSSDPDIIKNYITEAYTTWDIPPTYVLIIGDRDVFPYKTVTYPDYSFPNEDYFVEIEGNDFFPEMMIGRFTNQGDYRMTVMTNKFMLYEKTPYTAEPEWFKKSICCSNNAYDSQVETKRFAAGVMEADGGFAVDTMMSDGSGWGGQGCSYDVNDVVDKVNDGLSYLNYRGEGWYSGWSATCYDFQTNDVSNLNNGQKFTFVTSIGCGVAGFQSSGGNCFGEEWVQLGSLTSPRGGVAFIGPTSNTHTTYNNKIDKGIYVGMFREGMDTPGQAILRGKLYMYNVFGADYYCEYHYKVFCVLGDPSIHIWKEVPLEVSAQHVASLPVGNNQVEVTVSFTQSSLPAANAEVCITGSDVFVTAICDESGVATLDIMPEQQETLIVTVRGGNVIPYQGTIDIIQPVDLVEPEGDPLIVDIDGNTDGLINPNENGNISFVLKNWGTSAVNDVQATLTSTDDNVEIISTTPLQYGSITPGAVVNGDPFQFFVKSTCPIGVEIPVVLHITSTSGSWDYPYSVYVSGCSLAYNAFVVNEMGTANVDYRMNPGETVKMLISIENIGEDMAPDVTGVLSSNDSYISIVDSEGNFGSVDINGDAVNEDDFFIVSIDESCPAPYFAQFSLQLTTENGNYPYETTLQLSLPIGQPVTTDYTGPDEYGYYAYSSDDAFFDQTPVYNWVEITESGTHIVVPADVSDYTETVDLPFTFKYYGVNYNQLQISTDGWIALGAGNEVAPENTTLPNSSSISNMIAPLWDDLYNQTIVEGSILYYHDATNHQFVVEWDSIAHNDVSSEPKREIFQVLLLDPQYYETATGDGEIICQYQKVNQSETTTVGIENQMKNVGLQYVYDNQYDETAGRIGNEYAIKFTTEEPFVSITVGINDQFIVASSGDVLLDQNYPNPFSQQTTIHYTLINSSDVSLGIYNVNGELVRTLHNGYQFNGDYSFSWNGQNEAGANLYTGVYFYRLQVGDRSVARKMFMLK